MESAPPKTIPEFVECENPACRRKLETRTVTRHPDGNVQPKRVHRFYDPTTVSWSVLCPCGHFTVSEHQLPDKDARR
jgi:hypothetical protein